MAHGVDLLGFALAIAGRAELLPVAGPAMPSQACQKSVVLRLIGHAREHAALLAAFDLPERVAAELEIVALLVDRETAVALDQDAVVDARDQIVRRHRRGPGSSHTLGMRWNGTLDQESA